MTVKGVDVASYQSTSFSTSGLGFVFVKATEGTSYVNPRMVAQAKHGRQAGLVVGFYHFLHAGSVQAQAEYFVQRCASVEGDVLACDWESSSAGAASCAEKDAFLRAVKKLRPDHRVILYCNTDFWLHRDNTSFAADGLWIADPNHPAGHPRISAPWLVHQYSMAGGVDHNVAAFATPTALRAWAAGGATHGSKQTSEQNGDDDMPIRSSLGVDKAQTLPWNTWTKVVWGAEYQDNAHVHANGENPGYVSPASTWADFSGVVRVAGLTGQLQVRYEVHDWAAGRSASSWTELHADVNSTPGDDWIPLGGFSKGLAKGQHVYVSVQPIPAAGHEKDSAPKVTGGRWTIRQDRG